VPDYADRVHLYPSGGKKLAADVAPLVEKIGLQLGYLD
jgi:hypothetical protein